MSFFTLKEIISSFTRILPLSLLITVIGIVFVSRKKQVLGMTMVLAGITVLYGFSLFPVAGLLLRPLQTYYSRYQPTQSPVRYVVVLGGWHKTNRRIPLSSQLSKNSLIRVVEAITIYRQNPGSELILSGAAPQNDPFSNARMMAKMAVRLGVPGKDIILEERSRNTEEEARYIRKIVRAGAFVLVTSASHIRRAMLLFHEQSLFPVPAPVNFLVLDKIPFSLFPSVVALQSSEKALHEYFGILWAWLNGQI